MKTSNPYAPQTADSAASPIDQTNQRTRVLITVLVGFGCSLLGPAILVTYWLYHGIGISPRQSLSVFGFYLPTGMVAVAAGLLVGYPLSLISPHVRTRARVWLLLALIVTLQGLNFTLLANGRLNFEIEIGPLVFPAFSATSAVAAFVPTAMYLATSGTQRD